MATIMLEYLPPTIVLAGQSEVFVTHVVDPSHFHCQLMESSSRLKDLMDELHMHCSNCNLQEEALTSYDLGMPCLAQYTADKEWYRVIITGLLANGLVEVSFVDYGNNEIADSSRLRKMKPEFMELPIQAIQCGMANIVSPQGFWSPEHIAQFEDLILEKTFTAKFLSLLEGDSVCCVELLNSAGSSINKMYGSMTATYKMDGGSKFAGGDNLRVTVTDSEQGGHRREAFRDRGERKGFSAERGHPRSVYSERKLSSGSESSSSGSVRRPLGAGSERPSGRFSTGDGDKDHTPRSSNDRRWIEDKEGRIRNAFWGDSGPGRRCGNYNSHDDRLSTDYEAPARAGPRGSGKTWASGFEKSNSDRGSAQVTDMDNMFKSMMVSLGESCEVYVSFVNTPSEFWIQLSKSTEAVDELMEKINMFYGALSPSENRLRSVSEGMPCVAQYPEDERWYRAVIRQYAGENCEVQFVDYGNSDFVTTTGLRSVAPDFFTLPVQAVKCSLNSLDTSGSDWSDKAIAKFEELTMDKPLTCKFVCCGKGGATNVSLTDPANGADVTQTLLQAGLAQKTQVPGQRTTARSPPKNTAAPPPAGNFKEQLIRNEQKANVVVSWMTNPENFWCQLVSQQQQIIKLNKSLQLQYEKSRCRGIPPNSVRKDMPVIAKFSEDGCWYRGRVVEVSSSKAQVLFVDYGNTETVACTGLQYPQESTMKIPLLAVKCKLRHIKPVGDAWNPKAVSLLESVVGDEANAVFYQKQGDAYLIELFSGGKNASKELVKAGLGKIHGASQETIPSFPKIHLVQVNSEVTVYVTSIDGVDSFWCQPSFAETVDLETAYAGRTDTLVNPSVGMPCATKFSVDGLWYRAEVVQVMSSDCIVHFVDYGNAEVVKKSELKCVKPEFFEIPVQSFHCSLNGIQDDGSIELKNKFNELTHDKELKAKITHKEGEVFYLDLYESDSLLVKQLTPLCSVQTGTETMEFLPVPNMTGQSFKAYVSATVSLEEFYIQPAESQRDLDNMTELMKQYASGQGSPLQSATVGQICAVKYTEDQAWYRGKISAVHGKTVHAVFVDYGNSEDIPLSDTRKIVTSLLEVPPLAYPCRLAQVKAPAGVWTSQALAFFEELVMDKELDCKFITKNTVKMTAPNGDVGSLLVEAGHAESLETPASASLVRKYPPPTLPRDTLCGYVSCVNKSGLYIQPTENTEQLDQMTEELQRLSGKLEQEPGLNSVQLRQACCAKFSEDDSWYRGEVVEVKGKEVTVRFVDFGNLEAFDVAVLKNIPEALAKQAPLALHCFPDPKASLALPEVEKLLDDKHDKEITIKLLTKTAPFSVKLISESDSGPQDEDAGSSTRIEAVSPSSLPKPRLTPGILKGFVTQVDATGLVFVQKHGDEDPLTELSEKLQVYDADFTAGKFPLNDAKVGSKCCARFSEDEAWYRAEILKISTDKTTVRFIDFGNCDSVSSVTELRGIPADLTSIPPFCIQFRAQSLLSSKKISEVMQFVDGKCLEFEITSTVEPLDLKLKCQDGLQLMKLLQGPVPSGEPVDSTGLLENAGRSQSPSTRQSFPSTVLPQDKAPVYVTGVERSGQVFVQLARDEEKLMSLADRLQELGEGCPALTTAATGDCCCAKFSQDEMWYRAEVVSSDSSKVTVRFLDYGNLDEVDRSSLKAIPEEMLKEPFYCLTCRLIGCSELSEADVAYLLEHTTDKTVYVEFANKEEPYQIYLTSEEGEDLGVKLRESSKPTDEVPEKVQEPSQSPSPSFKVENRTSYRKQNVPKGKKTAYVTHVDDSGLFYIQLEDDTSKIDALSEKLMDLASELEQDNEPLEKVDPGSICCCKFSEDGLWYRACVMDKAPPWVHVRFIDYGNEDRVLEKEVYTLPQAIQSQPPFGFACCLQGIQLTPHQVAKLREITEGEAVSVIFLTSTDPYEVTMTNSEGKLIQTLLGPAIDHVAAIVDKLVADSLAESSAKAQDVAFTELHLKLGSREEMFVSHSVSPDQFWCQPAASETELAELMDFIADYCGQLTESERGITCSPNQPCLARFTEDESWYRAKVVSTQASGVEVFFVDYGNADIVPEADLVSIKPDYLTLPAQAVQCRLFACPPVSWDHSAVRKFAEVTAEKKLLAEMMSCDKTESGVVYTVLLRDMGVDLSTQLAMSTESQKPDSGLSHLLASDAESTGLTDSLKVQVSESPSPLSDTMENTTVPSGSCNTSATSDLFTRIRVIEGSRFEVTVSHSESPSHFWVHLKANSDQLKSMMDVFNEAMASTRPDDQPLAVTQACAALSAEDEVWYRGEVREINSALNLIDVFFVDYGCTESVDKVNVRPIPPEFMALPAQAVGCGLSEIRFQGTLWTMKAKNHFNDLVLDKSLIANIVQVGEDGDCIVQLLDMGICVARKMIEEGLGVSTDTRVPTPPHLKKVFTDSPFSGQPLKEEAESASNSDGDVFATPTSVKGGGGVEDIPKIRLIVGEERKVSVSHADSPGRFWCQLTSPLPQLEDLMARLQSNYSQTQTSTPIIPQSMWKTGQLCVAICNEDQQYYRAKIVSLSEDSAEVFYLDYGNVESVPLSAIQPICEDLLNLPAQAVRCSLAKVRPESISWEDNSCSRFEEMIYQKELVAKVVGFVDDTALVNLRDDTFSINDSLIQGGYAVPGTGAGQDLNEALLDSVCNTLNALDETSVSRTAPKKKLSELPSPIARSESGDGCEPDLKDFTCDGIQFNLTDYLNLDLEEGSELQVYVCNITDPGNFGLQPVCRSADLESLMADIAEHVCTDVTLTSSDELTIGFLCLAQFSDDDAWYRAKITDIEDDQYQVLYVDFGNSEWRPESKIRALPETMLSLPVQYIPCCLADIWSDGDNWLADTTAFFRDMCEDKTLKARIGKKENGLYHVYLFDEEDHTGWSLNRYLLSKGVQLIPGSELDIELEMEDSLQPDLEGSFHDMSITKESSFYDCENGLAVNDCAEADQNLEETKEISATESEQP
ncbi:uncharacterized protein LOC135470098 [Liolophura sinensis]|uniref:uncharacterized protein LOC135470098 n=1 Tax=Liolophura sinensis TaxID=3198878 RepID=UPI00315973E3